MYSPLFIGIPDTSRYLSKKGVSIHILGKILIVKAREKQALHFKIHLSAKHSLLNLFTSKRTRKQARTYVVCSFERFECSRFMKSFWKERAFINTSISGLTWLPRSSRFRRNKGNTRNPWTERLVSSHNDY